MNCNDKTFVEMNKINLQVPDNVDVFIAVPSIYLNEFYLYLPLKVQKGAQDVSIFNEGPFTGEISASMLASRDVSYVLVGHSERRINFGEDDHTINRKMKNAIKHVLKPILCIGELQKHRENGTCLLSLEEQFLKGSEGLEKCNFDVAYEPVWAIGSGKSADPFHIKEIIIAIKSWMVKKGIEGRVIYGGSVSEENVDSFAKIDELDGFLVGNASRDARFQSIISSMK
ncbi:hypothetical protein GINT2_000404 [Glugoides intestinalis]